MIVAAVLGVIVVIGAGLIVYSKMKGAPNASAGSATQPVVDTTPAPVAAPMFLGNLPSTTPLPASGMPGQSVRIGRTMFVYATRGQDINAGCAAPPCTPMIAQATGWKILSTI